MANAIYSGRLHPGGSGVYRPSWDTSGASLSIVGTGFQWGDNSADSYADLAPGAHAVADFSAQSDLALNMAGTVYAHGTGGCVVTLRRKSTGAVLAVSTACGYAGSWSSANSHVWITVNEDPNAALTEGDLCAETSHGSGVTATIQVTDLAFDTTTPPVAPSTGGRPRRGPRVYPLKSQQNTPRRGPGSYY